MDVGRQLRKQSIHQVLVTRLDNDVGIRRFQLLSASVTKQQLDEHERIEPHGSVLTGFQSLHVRNRAVFSVHLDGEAIEVEA